VLVRISPTCASAALRCARGLTIACTMISCSGETTDPGDTTPPPQEVAVVSVVVTPASASVITGFSEQFRAAVLDGKGNVLTGRTVTWSAANPDILQIDNTGLAKALAPGPTRVSAHSEGKTGSVDVTVSAGGGITGSYAAVTAGEAHTCALTRAGAAYCWGHDLYGQLGRGPAANVLPVPRENVPVAVAGNHVFRTISTRYFHTCAVTVDGAIYCWGNNGNGGLGNGTTTHSSIPVRVSGDLVFVSVSAGYMQTCGLVASGAAYCWGRNGIGEVGDGTFTDRLAPTPVAGNIAFVSISAGLNHTCGVSTTGAAYCWGWNQFGQLGDGMKEEYSNVPVPVSASTEFQSVSSARYLFTCAVSRSNDGYCWGRNSGGALGDGTPESFRSTPSPVAGGHRFIQIATGFEHTCAVSIGGAAYCWGSNLDGELGDPSIAENVLFPFRVAVPNVAFTSIAAGYRHTCGVTSLGGIYCWGWNDSGQAGIGSFSDRVMVPTPALNP